MSAVAAMRLTQLHGYAWTRYFGYTQKAEVCISAITGFMRAIPHWGYNGCGRAYWDFIYGGSNTMRIERIMSIIVSSAIFPSPNRTRKMSDKIGRKPHPPAYPGYPLYQALRGRAEFSRAMALIRDIEIRIRSRPDGGRLAQPTR